MDNKDLPLENKASEYKDSSGFLDKNEEHCRVLVEKMNEALVVLDDRGILTYANIKMSDLFGYSFEEMVGSSVFAFFDEKNGEILKENLIRRRSGESQSYEIECTGKYGNKFSTLISPQPLFDNEGNFKGSFAVFTDITGRKQSEDAVRLMYKELEGIVRERTEQLFVLNKELQQEIAERKQVEKLVRGLNRLQASILAPGRLDEKLKRITDGVVEVFCADFCRIWLTEMGDLCESGCFHAAITEGPHVCRFRDRCLKLKVSSGRYTHVDGKIHRRVPFGCYKIGRVASEEDRKFLTNNVLEDPRVHDHDWARELGLVSFAGYQLRPPGENTIGVLALFAKHTITSEEDELLESLSSMTAQMIKAVRAEELMVKTKEELEKANFHLEAVNKELEAFSYSVSHDLRSPLRSIDGFSLALLEDHSDSLNEEGRDFLIRVRRASQNMGELIDDLLTLSRMSRTEMYGENILLSSIAEDIAEELRRGEPERCVEFLITQGLTCYGDKKLLRIVLENLLGNAWKFTSKSSLARIEFGFSYHPGAGKSVYFVKDNGAGFDMSYVEKLFGPFQRLHTTAEFSGTGIGLATVKRIIRRHGGRVWAEGSVGEGATFYFTL